MTKLRVLDLFSGIGGFSLGLERTGGFRTVAFCEIEPYPRAVLAKHWPDVPCYDDVRTLTADTLRRDGIAVDVICGGFPCQDISFAGKRAGLEGARSGLWSEYARLVGELRPRFVIVENVPGLLSLGLGNVLGGLASLGYDATWDCIPAAAVGAPHRRDRVWIVAHAGCTRRRQDTGSASRDEGADEGWPSEHDHEPCCAGEGRSQRDVADAKGNRRKTKRKRTDTGYANRGNQLQFKTRESWFVEPDVGRVADGVPSRLDRLRALGNAVVPQIPELIGRAILQAEGMDA